MASSASPRRYICITHSWSSNLLPVADYFFTYTHSFYKYIYKYLTQTNIHTGSVYQSPYKTASFKIYASPQTCIVCL